MQRICRKTGVLSERFAWAKPNASSSGLSAVSTCTHTNTEAQLVFMLYRMSCSVSTCACVCVDHGFLLLFMIVYNLGRQSSWHADAELMLTGRACARALASSLSLSTNDSHYGLRRRRQALTVSRLPTDCREPSVCGPHLSSFNIIIYSVYLRVCVCARWRMIPSYLFHQECASACFSLPPLHSIFVCFCCAIQSVKASSQALFALILSSLSGFYLFFSVRVSVTMLTYVYTFLSSSLLRSFNHRYSHIFDVFSIIFCSRLKAPCLYE